MGAELKPRILVVEDEEPIAKLLTGYLTSVGFEVHSETFGEAALRYAEEHQPRLVILDLRLPDIHGFEVCKQLRKHHHSWALPILMLTGLDAPVDKLRGFAYGADAYVTKPFEPPELLPLVSFLLGKTEAADESFEVPPET